jgi:hypothetical protein
MTHSSQRPCHRIGPRDRHHLFGFHDVSPWSRDFNRMLALEVERIDHPPLATRPARVGVIDVATNEFQAHDDTSGWNFPQGARQIWLADGLRYAFNCPDGGAPRCRIRTAAGDLVAEIPWGVAAVSPAKDDIFSIDFGRIHRAGGYGHTGVAAWGTAGASRDMTGLVRYELGNGTATELVSLEECRRAVAGPTSADRTGSLDYFTHVVPSPSGLRVCFLYRSWLADGGMDTALCIVDAAGGGFRMLLRGNLSHFDWADDDAIVIWGPRRQLVTALRGRGGARRGWGTAVLRRVKDAVRPFVRRTGLLAATFLRVPLDGSAAEPLFSDAFTGDGHPSFCPSHREWMLCDTYPDRNGDRDLFLLDTSRRTKHMLGVFNEPSLPLDTSCIAAATQDVDPDVMRLIGPQRYARARSGLHCDLHPRWRTDGRQVTFDSLHDGTRQIYTVDTADILDETSRHGSYPTET